MTPEIPNLDETPLLNKDLRKIYNSLPKNFQSASISEGWVNVMESQNSKNIFGIRIF